MENFIYVRVHGHDLSTWTTALNPRLTDQEIRSYFIGQNFNISTPRDEENGKEHIVTAVKIDILNDNAETIRTLQSEY